VRVANKLPEVPAISDALRCGEVSYSKVRAMVRIATAANEALLLDYARFMTASQLEETCRKYALVLRHGPDPHPLGDLQRRYVRRRDTEDGMVKLEAVLHPEEAELIWTMLTHAAGQLLRSADSSTHDAEPTSKPVSAETPPIPPALDATSICNGANGKSLLDRLLDEVEGLRAAEATSEDTEHPTGPDPRSARPASELRRRADAVQRAFSRADALVRSHRDTCAATAGTGHRSRSCSPFPPAVCAPVARNQQVIRSW
jgi:hypothetical protein